MLRELGGPRQPVLARQRWHDDVARIGSRVLPDACVALEGFYTAVTTEISGQCTGVVLSPAPAEVELLADATLLASLTPWEGSYHPTLALAETIATLQAAGMYASRVSQGTARKGHYTDTEFHFPRYRIRYIEALFPQGEKAKSPGCW